MAKTQRPSVRDASRSNGAQAHERILEVHFPSGNAGCLISLLDAGGGLSVVEIYRADTGIRIRLPMGYDHDREMTVDRTRAASTEVE